MASQAHNRTYKPSKTTLSPPASTSTVADMGKVVHAQTSNKWMTDKRALGWHGGGGQTPSVRRVNEWGRRPGQVHILDFCWFCSSLRVCETAYSKLSTVEKDSAVHARTWKIWKTDKHALGWHGGGVQITLVRVKKWGGRLLLWILLTLLLSQSSIHTSLTAA